MLGMRLARIDSSDEHKWIIGEFGQKKAWIGLNDMNKEGDYVNADGCRRRFVAWAKGEPNNKDNEDCVQMWNRKGWNDNDCTQRFVFLCKINNKKKRTLCGTRKTGK